MTKQLRFTLAWLVICACATSTGATDIEWLGGVSNDATDGANWSGGSVPTSADRAVFSAGGSTATPDLGANNVAWDKLFFNNNGPTTLNGSGTITLNGAGGNPVFFSAGGPLPGPSIINPNITTTGDIQSNGNHDVTFNGSVTARKVEAFNSTSIYNGDVTVTGTGGSAFVTGFGKVVFNGNFHWTAAGGEYGLNGQAPDVTFTTLSSNNPSNLDGLNILNLHGDATVRNGQNDTFGQATDIWARTGINTYSLDGFNESLEFLGTNGGTNLVIKFGTTSGANSLIWPASHNMSGNYQVQEFEIGTDSMQLGAAGPQFFTDAQLARITINGIPYSANDPGNGSLYWNRDANLFVQFHNIPEPAGFVLLSFALIGLAMQRGSRGVWKA
jgi:hypothetical protein